MVGKPSVVSDEGVDEEPEEGEVSELTASFLSFTAAFTADGAGKPRVVSDEGTDEKPAKGDGAAPDGANTGFDAVVSEDGAVCACAVNASSPVNKKFEISRFKMGANMALTNDWCLKFVSFATLSKALLFYPLGRLSY